MSDRNIKCDNKILGAMTQVVLNEALNSVIDEFERNTDTQIGLITIGAKGEGQDKREMRIEVKDAGENCAVGLTRYQEVLCRDSRYKSEDFCKR